MSVKYYTTEKLVGKPFLIERVRETHPGGFKNSAMVSGIVLEDLTTVKFKHEFSATGNAGRTALTMKDKVPIMVRLHKEGSRHILKEV